MKPTRGGGLRGTASAAGVAGYALAAYCSVTFPAMRDMPMLGLAIALAPALALLLWLAWRSPRRPAMLALSGLAIVIAWHDRNTLGLHFPLIYLIDHAGANVLLAFTFGASRAGGRPPLAGPLPQGTLGGDTPAAEPRARRTTRAWALFFATIGASSCLLYALAPLEVWAAFAFFLTAPLLLLMAVGGYGTGFAKRPDARRQDRSEPVSPHELPEAGQAPVELPLVDYPSLDAVLAYCGDHPVPVRQFIGEVLQLAKTMPEGGHVLNLCADRYRFTVGLAAGIVSNRVSLLPSTHTPEMLRQMQRITPDVFCLTDQDNVGAELPVFRYPDHLGCDAGLNAIPRIPAGRLAVRIFTSGSTGVPQPHDKTWGSLVGGVRAGAAKLGIMPGYTVVGTVPAQHMYGLESTVLLPLLSGAALYSGRPFYPADIQAVLAGLPHPRLLVTTPYHLRILLDAGLDLPPVDRILSATAPLADDLAQRAETALHAPLHEIYGSTETGQLAMRRTTAGPEWQLLNGIELHLDDERTWAIGGHIETRTWLNDAIEPTGPGRFRLGGRNSDLINIAGKRTSLGYLNHQLLTIPGVQDGVFILPKEDGPEGIGRLTALVVAPTLTADELMQTLGKRLDPLFLPRPLLFVDTLPRNATGKLPAPLAQELLASAMTRQCGSA